MCDTFIYRSEGETSTRKIWFGKNSDREPNEAHEVIFMKGRIHEPGESVKCTYLEIPQAEKTQDVVLCKPAWMWGAEMGVNGSGVAIGNEALFTKGGASHMEALTGMDLLRLALERSTSAHSAMNCIVELLTQYGQGGNCGFSHPFYYNNSFLIADHKETWVLETIGKEWAARRSDSSTAISNGLTIGAERDETSPGFVNTRDLAGEKSDWLFTTFSQAGRRRACILEALREIPAEAEISAAFNALRSHHGSDTIPRNSLTDNTVCMHAGFGPIRLDQTTGSMVVDLSNEDMTIWITGTSAPCLSVFHPVRFSDLNNDLCISSEDDWWTNEIFHRNMLFCPEPLINTFRMERDALEAEFIQTTGRKTEIQGHNELQSRKMNFLITWREKSVMEKKVHGNILYRNAWKAFNSKTDLAIRL